MSRTFNLLHRLSSNRILIYSDAVAYGGHEIMTTHIIRELLHATTHEIIVVHNWKNTRFKKNLEELVEIRPYKILPTKVQSYRLQGLICWLQWWDIFTLCRLLTTQAPDLVIASQGNVELGSKMLIAAKILKKTLISYIPRDEHLEHKKNWLWLLHVRRIVNRYIMRHLVTNYITITETFASKIRQINPYATVFVLKNMTDVPGAMKEIQPVDGQKSAEICLAVIGALTTLKNQEFILHVLYHYKDQYPFLAKVRLLIIGEGTEERHLKHLADKYGLTPQVQFIGWSDNIALLWDQINFLCIPSNLEGVPLVMLEAAAHSVAILANDIDGMHDFLPPEMRYRLNDYVDFLNKLDSLIMYHDVTGRLIKQNYDKLTQYSSDTFRSNLLSIIQSCTN